MFLIFCIISIFILYPKSVFACMCGHSSVSEAYNYSDAIIIAKILSYEEAQFPLDIKYRDAKKGEMIDGQKVLIKTSKYFKTNKAGKIIELSQPNSSCDLQFDFEDIGKKVLLYLQYSKKYNAYSIITCGRTTSIESAQDDLSWLLKLPKSLGQTRISGKVNFSTGEGNFPPVPGIKISIKSQTRSFEVLTDQNGFYEVWNPPIGKYKISAEIPEDKILGWTTSVPDNWTYFWSVDKPDPKALMVTLKPRSCAGMDFMLKKK